MEVSTVPNLLKTSPSSRAGDRREPSGWNPRRKKEKLRTCPVYAPDGRLSEDQAASPSINLTA
jgi:hypothetical protein